MSVRERLIETVMTNQGYAWFGENRAGKLVDAILSELRSKELHEQLRIESNGMLTDVDFSGLWSCVGQIQRGGS